MNEWKWSKNEEYTKTPRNKSEMIDDLSQRFTRINSKIDCTKLSQRDMNIQTSINPYVKLDYINDIKNQDHFLRPQNSHIEKSI